MFKKDETHFYWNKEDKPEWLSNYFKSNEFSCNCTFPDCIEQKIAIELINRLTWLREACNSPMRIHSGYRCTKQQEAIRESGVATVVAKHSQHELGNAADVSCSRLTCPELFNLAQLKFKAIGSAYSFLHLDLRDDRIRRWVY